MRVLYTILIIALLSACSSTRGYRQQSWAKMPHQQAYAYCDYQMQQKPWTTVEACMKAQGWEPY